MSFGFGGIDIHSTKDVKEVRAKYGLPE